MVSFALFTCFTQVLPYQTYCLLDPNTKVGCCACVQCTLLAQLCIAQWHTFLVSHTLLEAVLPHPPHHTHTFFGNLGQFSAVWWLPSHDPPRVLLLVLPMSVYSVIGGTYFAITCPKTLGDRFQREHFCVTVPCLCHLQHSLTNI